MESREHITMDTKATKSIIVGVMNGPLWDLVLLKSLFLSCSSHLKSFNDFGCLQLLFHPFSNILQVLLSNLVEVGPVGADGQLHLFPGARGWS